MSWWRRHRLRIVAATALAIAAVYGCALFLGGYGGTNPYEFFPASSGRGRPVPVVVYWSGDMGVRMGIGADLIHALTARAIPVLAVNSPGLFGKARDRRFAEQAMENALSDALARSGSGKVVVVGSSFGADLVGAALGGVSRGLRSRIASVVLIVPETDVYFHADPTGLTYHGQPASDPDLTVPLLRGLPVTCIFGIEEKASLCPRPVMRGAARIGLAGNHYLRTSRRDAIAAVLAAIEHPPSLMN